MTVVHEVHGLVISDHEFSLPLDHSEPGGEKIGVFAREVAASDGRERPFLVFLQGGPGSESPRPTTPMMPRWMDRALKDYRVLFLDQRGTGRSTPVGTLEGMTPQEQYEYLVHFRADAIVRDAEAIRKELGVEKWSRSAPSLIPSAMPSSRKRRDVRTSPDGRRTSSEASRSCSARTFWRSSGYRS